MQNQFNLYFLIDHGSDITFAEDGFVAVVVLAEAAAVVVVEGLLWFAVVPVLAVAPVPVPMAEWVAVAVVAELVW